MSDRSIRLKIIFHLCQTVWDLILRSDPLFPQSPVCLPLLPTAGKKPRQISHAAQIRNRFAEHKVNPHRPSRLCLLLQKLHPLLCGYFRICIGDIQQDLFPLLCIRSCILQMLPERFCLFPHFLQFSSVLPDHRVHPAQIEELGCTCALIFLFYVCIMQERDPVIISDQTFPVDGTVLQIPAALQSFPDIAVLLIPGDRTPAQFGRRIILHRHTKGRLYMPAFSLGHPDHGSSRKKPVLHFPLWIFPQNRHERLIQIRKRRTFPQQSQLILREH